MRDSIVDRSVKFKFEGHGWLKIMFFNELMGLNLEWFFSDIAQYDEMNRELNVINGITVSA
jgi:hypothetical protein